MIKIKTIIATFVVLLSIGSPLVVKAAESPSSGTYQKIMASDTASFVIVSQPNDAVPLNTTTVVDSSGLGKGQSGIFYNLPRLKNAYYYKIRQDTAKWVLTNSVYPALYLPKGVVSPANYIIEIDIVKIGASNPVASCKVQMLEQLAGADFTPFIPTIDNTSDIVALNTETRYYNPALQANSLVCPNAMYILSSPGNTWLNTTLKYDSSAPGKYGTISAGEMDLEKYNKYGGVIVKEYVPTTTVNDITLQVKPYCLSSEGGVAAFTSGQYDNNTGVLNSGASAETKYLLASDNSLIIMSKGTTTPTTDTNITLQTNNYYTYEQITKGYLGKVPDTNFRYYEKQNKYYMYSTDGLVNGTFYSPSLNVLDTKLKWNSSGSDVNPVPDPGDKTTYTLRYDETGGLSQPYVEVTPGTEPVLGTPTKSGFKFTGWYVDQSLTTKYDWKKFSYVLGASYTVYAKWEASGKYTVRFYDDKTKLDSSAQFSVENQPSLPSNPKSTGYLFKNWSIVDTIASTSGTPYEASKFVPEVNKSYIMRAMWDVQGVILSVTPNKTEYWVGDEVDKSTLVVLVQTDSAGSTKTLSVGEFSVSPNKIDKSGDNTITVTYNSTGATSTVHLQGKADYITGITASYSGEDLYVSDTVPTGAIKVKLTYKSATTKETSDFSISPSTIKTAGTNTITVTASGYSTSITVNGKKRSDNDTTVGGMKLTGISATYVGSQLYVGDNISAGDIKVTAKYSDGSSQMLNSGDFNFSPSFVKTSGTNAIDVTYKDKSAKVNISAIDKSSSTNKDNASTKKPTAGNTSVKDSIGSSNTNSGTAGASSIDPKDKGTSAGYLSGKNILDPVGGTASTIVNDVDILTEIQSAGAKAVSVDITLINTAEGNVITTEMFELLSKKKLTLNVTMLSPVDKATRVGQWQINGKSISKGLSPVDLNITYSKIDKKNEIMYYVGVAPVSYGTGVSLTANMRDAYVTGTFLNMYQCTTEKANSSFVRNFLWLDTSEVSLPIEQGTSFCITDRTDVYPDGSDLVEEAVVIGEELLTEETVSGNEQEPDETEFDFSEDTTVKPDKVKSNFNWKIIPIVLVALVIVCGVASIIVKIRSSKKEDEDTPDDEE